MRNTFILLSLCSLAIPARAAGPCDTPALAGRFMLMNGMVAFCPSPGAAPVLKGGTGAARIPTAGFNTVAEFNPGSPLAQRMVFAGHSSSGLYRTLNGGDSWENVSGPGSGLEGTSRNVAALLPTRTAAGGTDVLAGISGAANGGAYLSGDGGEHWMQLSVGFNPATMNLSTLVKTSCSGCPVQYYSGSYGSGTYARTIPVLPPPALTGWCFGAATCNCSAVPPLGRGGQPFKLCGTGFQQLAAVEFGMAGSWSGPMQCRVLTAGSITCAATPLHLPGKVAIRLRNPDTRTGYAAQQFTYVP
jgi:hypothetical protein